MSLESFNDLLERHGFQRVFKNELIANCGMVEGFNADYSIPYAVDEKKLFTFLQTTQEKEYKKVCDKADFKSKFIKYLREQIASYGLLSILRGGVKWNGAHFKLLIAKPHNNLNAEEVERYKLNIVSVTEELVYNPEMGTGNGGRGDLTIFVNGLPVIWIELKSNSAGQNLLDAKRQYCKQRNPEELIFRYKQGCLAYFAIDLLEAAFATRLMKEQTHFMPYNQGNGMHKGNPSPKGGADIRTAYMWQEVLTRENVLDWIENYIVNEVVTTTGFDGKKKKTDRIIFPRYHQFREVNGILTDIATNGVSGQNYLVMDSPGSGKTYSIAWLAHHLASLHDAADKPIYNTVFVITDRLVVDDQLQKAVLRVPHVEGTVATMDDDCTSEDLSEAINYNTKIIVSSIQKFSFILDKVAPMADKKFAIIIDECHSSTKGNYISNVGKALSQEAAYNEYGEEWDDQDDINEVIEADIQRSKKHCNITMIGYSATPKKKTIELFGTKYYDESGKVKSRPFTCYSMQQAIEEEFILDVLKNYTTYKTYFKINKKVADNPEYKKKKTERAVLRYADLQPENIEQKVEIIVEHFLEKVEPLLNHTAKAMVVTSGREDAVRYMLAFDKYIRAHGLTGLKVLVAFTGGLKLKEDETIEYTEAKMNGFPDTRTKDAFNTSEYQILLVANKYQTGYDQELLVAMYVDKVLKGTSAVQTLGRLNRTSAGKSEVFVLDFRNDYEDIKKAFAPYYTDLELEGETDPNKLYEIERLVDSYHFISDAGLDEFIKIAIKEKRSDEDVSRWNGYLCEAKRVFDDIDDEENQHRVRKSIIKMVEGYSWILQVTDFEDAELHKKCIFYRFFAKYLRTGDGERIDASSLVDFVKFSQKKTRDGDAGGSGVKPITKTKVGGFTKIQPQEEDELIRIEELVKELNELYGADLDSKIQSPFIKQLIAILSLDAAVKMRAENPNNSESELLIYIRKELKRILAEGQDVNETFSDRVLENADMYETLAKFITTIIFEQNRKK